MLREPLAHDAIEALGLDPMVVAVDVEIDLVGEHDGVDLYAGRRVDEDYDHLVAGFPIHAVGGERGDDTEAAAR